MLISMVCFIFAVIKQINIPICDIFDNMITKKHIVIFTEGGGGGREEGVQSKILKKNRYKYFVLKKILPNL